VQRLITVILINGLILLISSPMSAQQPLQVASTTKEKETTNSFPVSFVDISSMAGLTEATVYGGIEQKKYIIETNGCGVAFFDYDNDGWIDVLLLSGTRLEGFPPGKEPTNKLYSNNRNGTFSDVTAKAGLRHAGWASSVSVGDYDNDGNEDLFITYWGQNILYHNNGNATSTDVTQKARLATKGTRWGSGSTFVDYDRDGKLDLFVANYLKFDLASAPEPGKGANCTWKGVPVNCGPRGLAPGFHSLYHNNGDGTFTDVSEKSGIAKGKGSYAMTAVAAAPILNRISTPQDVILVAATGVLLASAVALVGTRGSVSASPRPAEIGSSP